MAVGDVVKVTDINLSDSKVSPTNALVGFKFRTNGRLATREQESDPYNDRADEWIDGDSVTGIGGNYEVRLNKTSGDNPSGGSSAIDTKLALTEDRTWEWVRGDGGGSFNFEGTVEVFATGSDTPLDSADVSITVTSLPPI